MELRYGLNPDRHATASPVETDLPLRGLAGNPSYLNLLDGLGAWQLVREASVAVGVPVATTFKHVSPAGVATAGALDEVMSGLWVPHGVELSPIATAYVRARDCDPRSSFGDFVAVSEPVDGSLAQVLRGVVSDGIIAPGYEPGTVEVLAAKKDRRYLVLEVDAGFVAPEWESREVFGVRLSQRAATTRITPELVTAGGVRPLPDRILGDLLLAMVAARHTQSNTVTYARDGMVIGIGAGQQSRVDCTRLAGTKFDVWWLRRHPKVQALPFKASIRRQERINWQMRYIEGDRRVIRPMRAEDINLLLELNSCAERSVRTEYLSASAKSGRSTRRQLGSYLMPYITVGPPLDPGWSTPRPMSPISSGCSGLRRNLPARDVWCTRGGASAGSR